MTLDTLQKTLPCPVIGVIDAGVEAVAQYDTGKPLHLGLIATPVLVNRGVYQKKLLAKYPRMTVEAVSTPALQFFTSGDRDSFSVFAEKAMPQHSGDILHAEIAP